MLLVIVVYSTFPSLPGYGNIDCLCMTGFIQVLSISDPFLQPRCLSITTRGITNFDKVSAFIDSASNQLTHLKIKGRLGSMDGVFEALKMKTSIQSLSIEAFDVCFSSRTVHAVTEFLEANKSLTKFHFRVMSIHDDKSSSFAEELLVEVTKTLLTSKSAIQEFILNIDHLPSNAKNTNTFVYMVITLSDMPVSGTRLGAESWQMIARERERERKRKRKREREI